MQKEQRYSLQETPSMNHQVPQERNEAISTLSAIAYGFMGSQALFAALELGLFTILADEPCGLDHLAGRLKSFVAEWNAHAHPFN